MIFLYRDILELEKSGGQIELLGKCPEHVKATRKNSKKKAFPTGKIKISDIRNLKFYFLVKTFQNLLYFFHSEMYLYQY